MHWMFYQICKVFICQSNEVVIKQKGPCSYYFKMICISPHKTSEDFRAPLCTENRLSIFTVVENMNRELEAIENVDAYVEGIDEYLNIGVEISKI